MAKDFFDLDFGIDLGLDIHKAGKAIRREKIDVDYGGFMNDLPRIEGLFKRDVKSGKKIYKNYKAIKKDVQSIGSDFKSDFNFAKKETQRGISGLRKRFAKKPETRMHKPQYYVAYVQGGVMRKAQFTDKTRARAFREKYLASGIGDEVSNVLER